MYIKNELKIENYPEERKEIMYILKEKYKIIDDNNGRLGKLLKAYERF